MASDITLGILRLHIRTILSDAQSGELMGHAVTLVPCGHTCDHKTFLRFALPKICPLDQIPIVSTIQNHSVQQLVAAVQTPRDVYMDLVRRLLQHPAVQQNGQLVDVLESIFRELKSQKAQALLPHQQTCFRWAQQILVGQNISNVVVETLQEHFCPRIEASINAKPSIPKLQGGAPLTQDEIQQIWDKVVNQKKKIYKQMMSETRAKSGQSWISSWFGNATPPKYTLEQAQQLLHDYLVQESIEFLRPEIEWHTATMGAGWEAEEVTTHGEHIATGRIFKLRQHRGKYDTGGPPDNGSVEIKNYKAAITQVYLEALSANTPGRG